MHIDSTRLDRDRVFRASAEMGLPRSWAVSHYILLFLIFTCTLLTLTKSPCPPRRQKDELSLERGGGLVYSRCKISLVASDSLFSVPYGCRVQLPVVASRKVQYKRGATVATFRYSGSVAYIQRTLTAVQYTSAVSCTTHRHRAETVNAVCPVSQPGVASWPFGFLPIL